MGKNGGKRTLEGAEPLSMVPPVPGTSWALAVVQMGWGEETGRQSHWPGLPLQVLWLNDNGAGHCTRDLPFQTVGNVR